MLNKIQDFFKRKILRDPQARWNHQYAKGVWEGLKNPIEFERQKVCKSFFEKHKPNGNLLEIGCGEGMLIEYIFEGKGYGQYLGIDVSDLAILNCQKLKNEHTNFIVADMDNLVLSQKYDVILFNESINYSANIPRLLANCVQNILAKDGVFIMSLHQYKHSSQHWKEIHESLQTIDNQQVTNDRSSWDIEVLIPKQ
jgi:SAM-dependent methyltransferase